MDKKNKLAFARNNYILMIIGLVTIILGFLIMSIDTEQYGFGFFGITLGPIVVIAGFIIEFFAIMAKPKNPDNQ